MTQDVNISENSKRIARNTAMLYIRMLLLLFVGLFTSRVVLQALGVDDYGVYNAVGGFVALFSVVTSSISSAIVRFITCSLGGQDRERLRRVFSCCLGVELILAAIVIILVETVGLWFLNTQMDIPEGRLGAANWVLHCSLGLMLLSLLSISYNATITAHEKMGAYALISILEAVLKLAVALALYFSPVDKLKTYAVLMVVVALIIRVTYALYCRRHFEETRVGPSFNRALTGEIFSFAGWNCLWSGTFVFNTQGINVLSNLFFGVAVNAARGVATQVQGIVKQFVFNVINAINPQITKSYATGNRDYAYNLVSKGAKYAYLIVLFFVVPFLFEAETILRLWLKTVPPQAALFTRLELICVLLDVTLTSGATLILADGRIRNYYITISAISICIFFLTWLLFSLGCQAYIAYVVFIVIYLLMDIVRLIFICRVTGYPFTHFLREVLFRIAGPTAISIAAVALVVFLIPEASWWRALVSFLVSCLSMAVAVWFLSLTQGERAWALSRIPHKQK